MDFEHNTLNYILAWVNIIQGSIPQELVATLNSIFVSI